MNCENQVNVGALSFQYVMLFRLNCNSVAWEKNAHFTVSMSNSSERDLWFSMSPFGSVFWEELNTKLFSSLTMLIEILSQVFFHSAYKYFRERLLKAFKRNDDLIQFNFSTLK